MVIIVFVNIILNTLVCLLLFLLSCATLNVYYDRYKLVAVSIMDGAIMGIVGILSLSQSGSLLIYFALFLSSGIVIFYPIKLSKFALLEFVIVAYILLGWGINSLLKLLFYKLFKITVSSYIVFMFFRGIILCFLGFFIYAFFRLCYKKKDVSGFVYDVELSIFGKRIGLKMLLDSGNMMYDEGRGGVPVLMVSKGILEEKLKISFNAIELQELLCSTVSGKDASVKIIVPDRVFILKQETQEVVEAVVGVVDCKFNGYDGLLHSAVV